MRRDRRRVCFRPGELLVMAALAVYGFGALGYALGGTSFLLWCLALVAVAAPFVRAGVRRRRRELGRRREQRRGGRGPRPPPRGGDGRGGAPQTPPPPPPPPAPPPRPP